MRSKENCTPASCINLVHKIIINMTRKCFALQSPLVEKDKGCLTPPCKSSRNHHLPLWPPAETNVNLILLDKVCCSVACYSLTVYMCKYAFVSLRCKCRVSMAFISLAGSLKYQNLLIIQIGKYINSVQSG